MRFTYLSNDAQFFRNGFFDQNGNLTADETSFSSTRFTTFNPATGVTVTFSGNGFGVDSGDNFFGTITAITFARSGVTLGTVTDIAWGAGTFQDALDRLEINGRDFGLIAGLINQSTSVVIDASQATGSIEDYSADAPFSVLDTLITSPITLLDSPFDDRLIGGLGNDTVLFQDEAPGQFTYNEYEATEGNDRLDFTQASDRAFVWLDYDLDHIRPDGPLTATISDANNTGSISVVGFTDTLINVSNVLNSEGGGLETTSFNDTVSYTGGDNTFFTIRGNEGNDTFNIALNGGFVRVDYRSGNNGAPNNGINVDLSQNRVLDDGFGGVDTINLTNTSGRLEIRGSDLSDTFVGSNRSDSFITRAGNDTVDGGAGFDRVRYDRSNVESVTVDLAQGRANVDYVDSGSAVDTLTSIEEIRGSFTGNDNISGAGANERLEGRGGDDTLSGRGGNDTLEGDGGNDVIDGGNGNDDISGGANFDTISAGAGNDTVAGDNGRDLVFLNQGDDLYIDNSQGGTLGRDTVFAGLGNDTVQGGNGDDVFYGEDGDDVIFARLGDDTVFGGNGRDLVFLNQGNDVYIDNDQGGAFGRDTVFTGLGNDTVQGGNGDDVFYGEAGNDLIFARLGDDTVFGGDNFDTISAGLGNDEVHGGNGRDLIFLNQGNDVYIDNSQGGALGRDTVFAGLGNDTVQGGNGDDQFFGEDGNDLIFARLGNDTLGGGAGADTLNGGDGADTFIFNAADAGSGADVVQDFVLGTDTFQLSGAMAGNVTANLAAGPNAVVVAVNGTTIALLEGPDARGFDVGDIVFV